MTAMALAMMMVAAPEGELRHDIDLLGGLMPTDSFVSMASVTASYTLRTSEHLGWQAWGSWAGAWNKKLANELERTALSLGADAPPRFEHPEWLVGVGAEWRLPYDEVLESRLHAGPMFMTRAHADRGERFGVGVFLGGGLRAGIGGGFAGIVDVGGLVYTITEKYRADVKYLFTVRVGLGVSI